MKLLNKIQSILSLNKNFQNILEIDNTISYKNIHGIWDYYQIINTDFHNKYKKPENYTENNELLKKYEYLYNKYSQIQNIYKIHTSTDNEHIIIFYTKNNDNLYIFLKTFDYNKKYPFIIINININIIKGDFNNIINNINNLDYNALYIASYGKDIKVVNQNTVVEKIKYLLKDDPCYKEIHEVNERIYYTDIEKIWSYIKTTNDKYINIYGNQNNIIFNNEELLEYKCKLKKYKILNDLFEAHSFNIYDHLILIYIRQSDEILIFLKTFDILKNNNPFWTVRISIDLVKGNLIKFIMNKLDYNYDNNIYISCYVKLNNSFIPLPDLSNKK